MLPRFHRERTLLPAWGRRKQTKKVPSDPQSSLLTSRHARPERGTRKWRPFSLRSPRQPFGLPRLIAPEGGNQSFLTGPASRGGLSLPCGDCPSPDHLRRISVPDLPLQHLAEPVSGPFGSALPTPFPVSRSRVAHRTKPVSCTSVRQSRRFLPPCFPSGSFDPSGSALDGVHRPKAHLAGTPDNSSLPADATFYAHADGSSFRARLVPPGSLFHEPLGTNLMMPQRPVWCQLKSAFKGGFSDEYFCLIFNRMR